MTPREIATSTANALWNDRARLGVIVHYDEEAICGGMHARMQPPVAITLPTGACVRMGGSTTADKLGCVSVDAGIYTETFVYEADSLPIRIAWAAVQCEAMLGILGASIPVPEVRPAFGRRVLRSLGFGETALDPDLRTLPIILAEQVAHAASIREPMRCEETYVRDVKKEGRGVKAERSRSGWYSVGSGIIMQQDQRYAPNGWSHDRTHMICHPEWGAVRVPSDPILRALEERRSRTFRNVLPAHNALHAPQARISGNARFEAIRRLCSDVLREDPDMRDASGTPLAPLLETHLPRLLANHAKASKKASPSEAAGLDEELTRGFEIVRAAFHEGLSRSRSDHRDAFRADLLFLETRHPGTTKETSSCR